MRRRAEMEVGLAAPALLDVNQPDYSTQLTKALGLQSRVPGHLDRRIQLGVNLDDYTQPEFWHLRAGQLGQFSTAISAVAGQAGWLQIRPSAGKMVIVEEITVANFGGAAPLQFTYGFAVGEGGGTTFQGGTRDDRSLFTGTALSPVSFGTSAVPLLPVNGLGICPINETMTIPVQFVLTSPTVGASPFNVFKVLSGMANQRADFGIKWRERFILPSEKEFA